MLIVQVLVASVITYLTLKIIERLQEWRKLPPGPFGLPILGYAPFIRYQFVDDIKTLFKRYGKIFTVNIYGTNVVMVRDVELLKTIMMRDSFNHRPKDWLFTLIGERSLISWNGQEWREQRRFALRTFKQLGLGSPEIEEKIHGELEYLFKEVNKAMERISKDDGIRVNSFLGPSTANVINLLLTGERYDFDDCRRSIIDETYLPSSLSTGKQNPATLGISNYWTSLISLQQYFNSGTKKFFDNYIKINEYLKGRVAQQRKTFDPDWQEPLNFVQAYLKEIKVRSMNGKYFDESHLYANVLNFFDAGAATTKDFMEWFLIYLTIHKDVQEKMRQEIDDHVGNEKISMRHKALLPFCEAVMEEVQRLSSSTPLGIIHEVSEEVELGSYTLPKGTHVMPCTLEVHMNQEYFPEPEKFRPERFLSRDQKQFVRDDRLIGFGTGKRSCPGEPIARTQIFIYIMSFVQRYLIFPPERKLVSSKAKIDGLSRVPMEPLRCIFKQRERASQSSTQM